MPIFRDELHRAARPWNLHLQLGALMYCSFFWKCPVQGTDQIDIELGCPETNIDPKELYSGCPLGRIVSCRGEMLLSRREMLRFCTPMVTFRTFTVKKHLVGSGGTPAIQASLRSVFRLKLCIYFSQASS